MNKSNGEGENSRTSTPPPPPPNRDGEAVGKAEVRQDEDAKVLRRLLWAGSRGAVQATERRLKRREMFTGCISLLTSPNCRHTWIHVSKL